MVLIFNAMAWLFALAGTIGSIVSVLAAVVVFWKAGGNRASKDAIDSYKAAHEADSIRIEQLEQRVGTCERLHRENLEKSGQLQGELATVTKVLQGRNPEMETFMKTSMDHMAQGRAFMDSFKDLPQVMAEMKTFLGGINAHMEKAA